MTLFNRLSIVLIGALACSILSGQQVPSKPSSYPIFTPFIINPAIAGSKDFTNLNLMVRVNGTPGAQMFTYNNRMAGKNRSAISLPGEINYSNFGLGGYLVHDQLESSRNLGFGVSGSFHIALDKAKLSHLSFGLSARSTLNVVNGGSEIPSGASNHFTPNIDFGLYYYGPTAFAGLSSTNILRVFNDTLKVYGDEAFIPREYNFYGGYKFLLSRKHAIVLEPSVLIAVNDSTLSETGKHILPYLKLYLENFYIGTYFRDLDHLSLFMQYQFPRLFTGVFIEFPRTGFLTSDNIIIELSLGLNLGKNKAAFLKNRHW